MNLVADHAVSAGIPIRFAAGKLIEGDEDILHAMKLSKNEEEMLEHIISQMENERGLDRAAAIADMRFSFINKVCDMTVTKPKESKEHERSRKIDRWLTGKYTAIPAFILIMAAVFYLTFNVIGAWLQGLLEIGIELLTDKTDAMFQTLGVNEAIHSLVIDGIFTGVGSVLSFLPIIIILFLFLSLLEDSGYMARVAFVMDKLLRKIGLSGRSFVPMIIGFGCSVPAIMAARTLSSERDRKMTIMLIPFVSCSAKIPIYAVFSAAFFPKHSAIMMFALYIFGIIMGIITALILNKTAFRGNPVPFVMELPNYRLPSAKSVLLLMWDKAKDFLQKAFTVIFIATVIIWFLGAFDSRLNYVTDSADSLLASIGRLLSPIFAPLGLSDWRISTSLIAGLSAKEAVVSTLGVLMGTGLDSLDTALSSVFNPLTAASFLVFTLLYTPCVATMATLKAELGSRLHTAGVIALQCVIAWVCAFLIYNLGLLLGL
jgi:ferrous iron transport protein B